MSMHARLTVAVPECFVRAARCTAEYSQAGQGVYWRTLRQYSFENCSRQRAGVCGVDRIRHADSQASKGTSGRLSNSSAGQRRSAVSPWSSGHSSLAALLAYLYNAQPVVQISGFYDTGCTRQCMMVHASWVYNLTVNTPVQQTRSTSLPCSCE